MVRFRSHRQRRDVGAIAERNGGWIAGSAVITDPRACVSPPRTERSRDSRTRSPGSEVYVVRHASQRSDGQRFVFSTNQLIHANYYHIIYLSSARKMTRKEYLFKGEGAQGIAADVFYPEGDSSTTFPIGSWAIFTPLLAITGVG